MILRKITLFLVLFAFLLPSALYLNADPALGAGPMPFDPLIVPGLDPWTREHMLCSPIDTGCGASLYWRHW
ncbi:MAG: hypothetical protein AAF748_07675 [Pseudomonadota bacterium]